MKELKKEENNLFLLTITFPKIHSKTHTKFHPNAKMNVKFGFRRPNLQNPNFT